ncbi:MAG: hypothetical protein ACR2NO_06350 [Chloroflexota bacterium]
MNRTVAEDLKHDIEGEPLDQSVFRMAYNVDRLADLKHDPATPRAQTLGRVLAWMRTSCPGYVPRYDAAYFSDR